MTTKEEAIEYLKSEHEIDVAALIEASEANVDVAELSQKLTTALEATGIIKLSNGETLNAEDIVLSVGQLVEEKTELSNRVDALEKASAQAVAEADVDKLIEGGYFAEAQREALVSLRLSNEETFKALTPEQPVIKLSGEAAAFVPADEAPDTTRDAELERLAAL